MTLLSPNCNREFGIKEVGKNSVDPRKCILSTEIGLQVIMFWMNDSRPWQAPCDTEPALLIMDHVRTLQCFRCIVILYKREE